LHCLIFLTLVVVHGDYLKKKRVNISILLKKKIQNPSIIKALLVFSAHLTTLQTKTTILFFCTKPAAALREQKDHTPIKEAKKNEIKTKKENTAKPKHDRILDQ
jgi:hypothetical protein